MLKPNKLLIFCAITALASPLICMGQTLAPPKVATESKTISEESGEAKPKEYVRIIRNERKLAQALQTSIIKFGDSPQYSNATVDLIGAIHLGEASYYEALNNAFSEYDVLLFEAVMPAEAVRRGFRPGGGKGTGRRLTDEDAWNEAKIGLHAIGTLQTTMKDALGLEFQLAAIDYYQPNFVHADMTQEEFEGSMAKRGESFSQILAREMGRAAIQQQDKNPFAQQLDLVFSLVASDRTFAMRRIAAVELAKANEGTAFAEADGTSTIITERNIKAFQVLRQQLNKGKKRIGIFYGAGHFPDMEERLVKEFGLVRKSESWLTAWELRAPKTE